MCVNNGAHNDILVLVVYIMATFSLYFLDMAIMILYLDIIMFYSVLFRISFSRIISLTIKFIDPAYLYIKIIIRHY